MIKIFATLGTLAVMVMFAAAALGVVLAAYVIAAEIFTACENLRDRWKK